MLIYFSSSPFFFTRVFRGGLRAFEGNRLCYQTLTFIFKDIFFHNLYKIKKYANFQIKGLLYY